MSESPNRGPDAATNGEPPPSVDTESASLVGRAFARWRRVLLEMAASARLPFGAGDDPDLPPEQADRLRAEMRACLAAKGGEVLARAQAAGIASAYLGLSPTGRARFFQLLAESFGVDRDAVDGAIEAYRDATDEADRLATERALRRALVSPAMRLLTKFNALPEGMKLLIDMRADLLTMASDDPALRALDADFRHLLATWFDVGFLTLERVTWNSPASLLETIIAYEAVHEVRSWSDLRHRLDGDRRCYAFFHPSLPRVPLIFVQVALVEGLAEAIGPLLDEEGPGLDPGRADSAIFYSITNTLYGLRGISFGAFLIKQVVDDLARDLPNLRQFATLSPMPRLLAWLAAQSPSDWLETGETTALEAAGVAPAQLVETLARPGWLERPELAAAAEQPMRRAAARYLVARGDDGLPIDPVARFHLGNGARIERLDWCADPSPRRLAQSAGLMVNYLYDRPEIEQNHEAYASQHVITVATEIAALLDGGDGTAAGSLRVSRRSRRLGRMIGRA